MEELDYLRDECWHAAAEGRATEQRNRTGLQDISNRENIEPGLLMLLVSDLWDKGFKEVYRKNNETGIWKNWDEYL